MSDADWKKVAAALTTQAIFCAKLLAGEMPQDIEDAFRAAKQSLFPEKLKDLTTDCSCPDWSNPCKHVAAVYYLLGEEFDRDPFLIFKPRGKPREEFLKLLSAGHGGRRHEPEIAALSDGQSDQPAPECGDTTEEPHGRRTRAARSPTRSSRAATRRATPSASKPLTPPEPLPADAAAFWSGAELPATLFGEVQPAVVTAALPKRLGNFPFWRGVGIG